MSKDPGSVRPLTEDSSFEDEEYNVAISPPTPWNTAAQKSISSTTSKQRHKPTVMQFPSKLSASGTNQVSDFFSLLPTNNSNHIRRPPRRAQRPTHSVGTAYDTLVAQSQEMVSTNERNAINRQRQHHVLNMGIQQLSDENIQAEKKQLRFHLIKNEIDILQQGLDPFVFEMKTAHECEIYSSVYRNYVRMQSIQDMGIPIYSLGEQVEGPDDKVMMPQNSQSFYRRIRRRNGPEFLAPDLIRRPRRKRGECSKT